MASPYERVLDWTGRHTNYAEAADNIYTYGIFNNDDPCAEAIAELTYTKQGHKWLKLLDLSLCPALDLAFATQDIDFLRLGSIFTEAVAGTIRLTASAHPTTVTKLYGRSGTLLAFLRGLGTHIEQAGGIEGVKVKIDGRWLVFKAGGS